MTSFAVTVENIGKVYDGDSREEAHEDFLLYRRRSILNMGRGAQEDVTLWADGEPVADHCGSCPTAADVQDALAWSSNTGWQAATGPGAATLTKGKWRLTWRTVEDQWVEYTLASGQITRSGAYLDQLLAQTKRELTELAGAL